MKICYLTSNIDPTNGGGRYAADLIRGVKEAGHEVIILKEENDGFAGEMILRRGPGLLLSAIKARKYMKNCDIAHALDAYPYGIIALLANVFCRKKLVITAQGTYAVAPLYNLKTNLLARWAYNSAEGIVAISRYTKSELAKRIRNKDIEIINHGINLEKFQNKLMGWNERENFILSVGALKHRKGYHVSIPAFALAKKEMPELKYKIVGSQKDTNYFTKLKNIVKKYNVESDVEFISGISDDELNTLYERAKTFILTSVNHIHDFEGFGLVFLEAAAAGLPVIGTLGSGIEDAVKDGYNGALVSQGDIEKSSSAIIAIMSDEDKWQNLSENSRTWALDHDSKIVGNKYLSLYKKILAR